MSRTRRILSRGGLLLAGAIVVMVVALWVLTTTGTVTVYRVTSDSMAPAFRAGHLLIARPVEAVDLARGDVVTVTAPSGANITHRIEEVAPGLDGSTRLLTLRGDANASPDATPYLVGRTWRVVLGLPLLGYWAAVPALSRALLLGAIAALGAAVTVVRRSRVAVEAVQ